MSMPEFPAVNCELTIEKALAMILSSIAMEELAFSRVVNAESEKLNCILENCCNIDPCLLLDVNRSVTNLLDKVMENQLILKNKMERALDALCCCSPSSLSCCPIDKSPCPPSCPPTCSCDSLFKIGNYKWFKNNPLVLIAVKNCPLCLKNNSQIMLPPGTYNICLRMFSQWQPKEDVIIELNTPSNVVSNPTTFCFPRECDFSGITANSTITVPCSEKNSPLKFVLISPYSITIDSLVVSIFRKMN